MVDGAENTAAQASDKERFRLGRPAIVCRWRLSAGALPLENRHLRALGARTHNGVRVSKQLVAWAKQHIEWTLTEGSAQHPDGVLMLVIDVDGKAAMTVGEYRRLPETSLVYLLHRATTARDESMSTGVAPEIVCAVADGSLVMGLPAGERSSGAASLVSDLARTVGIDVERREHLADDVAAHPPLYDEVFLVSDEHGIVVANGYEGSTSTRMRDGYERLMERERE